MAKKRSTDSEIEKVAEKLQLLKKEVHRGIVGQEDLIDGLLTGVLAGGHILIEGVPGLAKTRAVNLLARACKTSFRRIQFTPDLMPGDILGTRIYNQQKGNFEIVLGPIFAGFLLADEINRAPAKVQSALLEAMQERQVTIGNQSHNLPEPFLVFATQNPVEQEGTYPLPEAQLDRFLLKVVVPYPEPHEEEEIVRMVIEETELPDIEQVLTLAELKEMQELVRDVFVEDRIATYATALVKATRNPESFGLPLAPFIEYGASPRASIGLVLAARARAVIAGRASVLPDDVKTVAHDVLRHRIIRSYHAEAEGVKTDDLISKILGAVPVS